MSNQPQKDFNHPNIFDEARERIISSKPLFVSNDLNIISSQKRSVRSKNIRNFDNFYFQGLLDMERQNVTDLQLTPKEELALPKLNWALNLGKKYERNDFLSRISAVINWGSNINCPEHFLPQPIMEFWNKENEYKRINEHQGKAPLLHLKH